MAMANGWRRRHVLPARYTGVNFCNRSLTQRHVTCTIEDPSPSLCVVAYRYNYLLLAHILKNQS